MATIFTKSLKSSIEGMRLNSRVVSDKFENEVIVVNLENGFYYSFRNAAAIIWKLIEESDASREAVLAKFNFKTDEDEKEISSFIDFLFADKLISEFNADNELTAQADKLEYSKPEYSKFEDMADLIMIDPIHEADNKKGWPEKPA